MIEISNLSKHFYIGEKRIDVLRELNLSIKKDFEKVRKSINFGGTHPKVIYY